MKDTCIEDHVREARGIRTKDELGRLQELLRPFEGHTGGSKADPLLFIRS